MAYEPGTYLGMFVGGVVFADDVRGEFGIHLGMDLHRKGTIPHVDGERRCEQRRCREKSGAKVTPMAVVIMGLSTDIALIDRRTDEQIG
jgi:hypothetical protein